MFGKGIRIFRLFGFDVRVDASWIIIAVLLTWSLATGVFPHYVQGLSRSTYWWMGAIGMLGLFLSVVFHELSHSLVARRFGLPIKGITLFIFGGVSEMEDEPANAKTEFFMAIAGPLSSIVIGIVFLFLRSWSRNAGLAASVTWLLYYLGFINLILAGFNLLPAFPLDGGRVFRAALWNYKKDIFWATRVAARFGGAFGWFLIIAGILFIFRGQFISGMWWVLIGLFLRAASHGSLFRIEMRMALKGQPVSRFMRNDPVTAPPSITLSQLVTDYMYRYHFKMFPVVDSGNLLGCITTNEIKATPREEWGRRLVGETAVACSSENAVAANTDAVEALKLMSRHNRSRLLVVEDGKLVGIISLKDMLKFISLKMDLEGVQHLGRAT
jgi:Zn-dependent protease/predicted transcriptional regulator